MSDLIDIEIDGVHLQVVADHDANENLFSNEILLDGKNITEWFTEGKATLDRIDTKMIAIIEHNKAIKQMRKTWNGFADFGGLNNEY